MEIFVKTQEIESQIESKTDNARKKQYVPPVIKEYGQVASLTRGGAASARSDSGSNRMRPG